MATTPRPSAGGANRATRRASTKKTSSAKPASTAKKEATVSKEDLAPEEPKTTAMATLDELDAEVAEIPDREPFTLHLGDDENGDPIIVTVGSPGDVPYAIASSNSLDAVFSHAMSDEDWEKFIDADLTTAQAGVAFIKWRKYYGMGTPGE